MRVLFAWVVPDEALGILSFGACCAKDILAKGSWEKVNNIWRFQQCRVPLIYPSIL